MTNSELKGVLLARVANLSGHLKKHRQTVTLMKADLRAERSAMDQVQGQLTATQAALEELDTPFVPPPPPKRPSEPGTPTPP